MKKLRLLLPVFTGLTALPCATISLATSCGTNSIEIKKNDNITITTIGNVEKGKILVLNYSITNGYGFDISNSKITIGSDRVVLLLQCTIDEENKTITVPSNYVTDTKVVVDIKVEAITTPTITPSKYIQAWENITKPTENRRVTVDMLDTYVHSDGKDDRVTNEIFTFNGTNTHLLQHKIVNGKQTEKLDERWAKKDTNVGYWDFEYRPSLDDIYASSFTLDYADGVIVSESKRFSGDFNNFARYDLFNCYWGVNYIGNTIYDTFIKFDSNSKITAFAYTGYTINKGTYSIASTIAKVTYSADQIVFPTNFKINQNYLHQMSQGVSELDISNKRFAGRYEFYAPSTGSGDLKLTFDTSMSAVSKDSISIWCEDNGLLDDSDWKFSNDHKAIEIQSGKYSPNKQVKLTICTANYIIGTNANKVTVSIA